MNDDINLFRCICNGVIPHFVQYNSKWDSGKASAWLPCKGSPSLGEGIDSVPSFPCAVYLSSFERRFLKWRFFRCDADSFGNSWIFHCQLPHTNVGKSKAVSHLNVLIVLARSHPQTFKLKKMVYSRYRFHSTHHFHYENVFRSIIQRATKF